MWLSRLFSLEVLLLHLSHRIRLLLPLTINIGARLARSQHWRHDTRVVHMMLPWTHLIASRRRIPDPSNHESRPHRIHQSRLPMATGRMPTPY